ncbi:peptidoglycan-binding domain-containing protein [Amycolatopsis cihanbeyliensis]|uniref:Peptidoglycan hydrolase-like protein with peptidoglycan-binding domain n=1 Tax=Amycolatopsis cihanbeyliensis TaxID=1128664 RepID=A0A542DMP0_AMYCI|nr:peptidoglycan-binding protein [Amycolatopsis cihanbeyliensis]TQJ04356.1 peptidoglycan hydrolase-like protein with peptidoglycan-binding domain [Amycolatopsis cihanbeyliensis]
MRRLRYRQLWRAVAAGAALAVLATPVQAHAQQEAAAPDCSGVRTDYRTYPVLRAGDSRAEVAAAQCLLHDAGHYSGAATGSMDTGTVSAVRDYQDAKGLPSSGELGARAWTALLSAGTTPLLRDGASGAAVSRVQRALNAALSADLAMDGLFGPNTESAVRGYQSSRGLGVDGVVGPNTWAALQSGKGVSGGNPPSDAFRVFLAPANAGGSDANSGLSVSEPILTLNRAQRVLAEANPDTDVEVRIRQGTYVAPQTDWRFYVPGHSVSFIPIDYRPGDDAGDIAGRPVFTNVRDGGGYRPGWWFRVMLPSDPDDPLYEGGDTSVDFRYLRVQNYTNGLSFDGQTPRKYEDENGWRIKPSEGVNGNSVFGMDFRNIGNRHAPGKTGYGAILTTNSSDNRITNNAFNNIENSGNQVGLIHGLYITHYSSSNVVERNKFERVSGDPVKVRNESNYNSFEHNTFIRTGRSAHYRGEFCDAACKRKNPGTSRQCASYHNRFFRNDLGRNYAGTRNLPTWDLSPDGLTNAGGGRCSLPSGEKRLATGYNTY